MTPGAGIGPMPRDPGVRRQWLGGFNLMPYRARDARQARQRRRIEWSAAVLLGSATLAVSYAGRAVESARLDERRAGIERRLAQWAPRLTRAQAIERAHAERDAHRAAQQQWAASRERAVALFDVLRGLRYDGVRIEAIRQDARGARIRMWAIDSVAAARWFDALRTARGDWRIDVGDWQPAVAAESDAQAKSRAVVRVALSIRIHWPEPLGIAPASRAGQAIALSREDA